MEKPVIVCLCGSTKFKKEFIEANKRITLSGKIVLSVGMFGHQEGIDMNGPVKKMLDELHLRKIDLAGEVFVINPKVRRCTICKKWWKWNPPPGNIGGWWCWVCDCHKEVGPLEKVPYEEAPYIGESTAREIEYATQQEKVITYLEN